MNDKSLELKLCPNCGSSKYLENYPNVGISICEECGHEITSIRLKIIQEEIEETAYACPSCGKESETEEVLFADRDITVFKCQACSKLDGYRILPSTFVDNERLDDNDFDRKAVAIAKTEGKLIYSAIASKKGKSSTAYVKEFERIINEKSEIMNKLGVAFETSNFAMEKANNFLAQKGPFDEKQLKYLFSASFVLAQSKLLSLGELKGTRISERQISEIFNVDRKTTRKWKRTLETDTF